MYIYKKCAEKMTIDDRIPRNKRPFFQMKNNFYDFFFKVYRISTSPVVQASGGAPLNLDKIGDIHGHLFDLRVVEGFDVLEGSTIIGRHEVDRNTLPTESTTATNPARDINIRRQTR